MTGLARAGAGDLAPPGLIGEPGAAQAGDEPAGGAPAAGQPDGGQVEVGRQQAGRGQPGGASQRDRHPQQPGRPGYRTSHLADQHTAADRRV